MKADTYELATIFGKDVRYIVPLYQRPYVWNRLEHWEPLWEDVQWVLGRLDEPAEDGKRSPHFLGAIVLEQEQTQVGEIDVRTVIDGQQRLTTLQLFISAASDVALRHGSDVEARLLRALTTNNPDLAKNEQERFKVWPTNANHAAFRAVMSADPAAEPDDPSNLVQEAYVYFVDAFEAWASDEADNGAQADFSKLTAVVRDLLKLVVIDLDPEDDAQVIFESLNARGTPLLAVDLVKNLIFQRAERSHERIDLDRLYEEKWSSFDTKYWRKKVVQGRLTRPRAELFLMHWLTMKRAEEVHADHLYGTFKKTMDAADQPITDAVDEFAHDRDIYRSFDEQPAGSVTAKFFQRLDALDTSTALPIALLLFRRQLDPNRRDAALRMLESWLVRRMLCRLTAQGYNRLFVDLLRLLRTSDTPEESVIYGFLTASDADSARWPSDDELRTALLTEPLYTRIVRKRLVMILAALENDLRSNMAEEVPIPADLWVEHVLPRKWHAHWPVEEDDPQASDRREAHVHRLGNLTLVTKKLNPSMSNAEWSKKRAALAKHSILAMNQRIVNADADGWDENRIDQRSQELADRIIRLWPGPETPLEKWI